MNVAPPLISPSAPCRGTRPYRLNVGSVTVGGGAPVVVQSMTNTGHGGRGTTPAGCRMWPGRVEMVRITVDRERRPPAVPQVKDASCGWALTAPIVGDFHYIGNKLRPIIRLRGSARQVPHQSRQCGLQGKRDVSSAPSSTWRSNTAAGAHRRQLGVLDQALLTRLMTRTPSCPTAADMRASPARRWCSRADVGCRAEEMGMPRSRIIRSAKVSAVPGPHCRLHPLGARSDTPSISAHGGPAWARRASWLSAAMGILLQQGIRDTCGSR